MRMGLRNVFIRWAANDNIRHSPYLTLSHSLPPRDRACLPTAANWSATTDNARERHLGLSPLVIANYRRLRRQHVLCACVTTVSADPSDFASEDDAVKLSHWESGDACKTCNMGRRAVWGFVLSGIVLLLEEIFLAMRVLYDDTEARAAEARALRAKHKWNMYAKPSTDTRPSFFMEMQGGLSTSHCTRLPSVCWRWFYIVSPVLSEFTMMAGL